MTTSAIWISFDLGVRGNYPALYTWLDSHLAKECGDSLAFLNYTYDGDLKDALKVDLGRCMTPHSPTRVYLIYRDKSSNRNKGVFVFGGRRAPAWTGFAQKDDTGVDEDL